MAAEGGPGCRFPAETARAMPARGKDRACRGRPIRRDLRSACPCYRPTLPVGTQGFRTPRPTRDGADSRGYTRSYVASVFDLWRVVIRDRPATSLWEICGTIDFANL